MVIDNKFDIGQIVYLKTDEDQLPRIITGLTIRGNNVLVYCLSSGTSESWHYDFEISEEKVLINSI